MNIRNKNQPTLRKSSTLQHDRGIRDSYDRVSSPWGVFTTSDIYPWQDITVTDLLEQWTKWWDCIVALKGLGLWRLRTRWDKMVWTPTAKSLLNTIKHAAYMRLSGSINIWPRFKDYIKYTPVIFRCVLIQVERIQEIFFAIFRNFSPPVQRVSSWWSGPMQHMFK